MSVTEAASSAGPRPVASRPTLGFRQAPLVPVALAMTAGIVVDRFYQIPVPLSLIVAFVGILAWQFHRFTRTNSLALAYLWFSVAAAGSAYHHLFRHVIAADDISHAASTEPTPVRLRGVVQSSPTLQPAGPDDPLRSFPTHATTRFTTRVTQRQNLADGVWAPASGVVQVAVAGLRSDFTVGDDIELVGRLGLPDEPGNPGEFNYGDYLHDQQIGAILTVRGEDDVRVLRAGWPGSLFGWLAVVRGWGQRILGEQVPEQAGLAVALLLGEGSGLSHDDWDVYQRTGVIHVLAISGQHLVVLAGFLWLFARLGNFRRRQVAPLVALALVGYALLAGGRPPVMRAAWMVAAYAGALMLRRPMMPPNLFALAWIAVLLVNPADAFNTGCQLSFLAVAVLIWGVGRWPTAEPNPLAAMTQASRPWWQACLYDGFRWIAWCYVVNALVWLAVTPLVAGRYHLISPIALILGPPLVLLTSIALLAGFALLLLAPWAGPLAWPFALLTHACLAGCDSLVTVAGNIPGAYFFVPDLSDWWLAIFYAALLLMLAIPSLHGLGRPLLGAGAVWLALGVALLFWPHRPGEFRCTFLAVGHGGCTVLETPDGRVLLYDAGAITGPDVTRRQIAPFLWTRGIRRIDEVYLSHADLDHFNGIPALVDRFRVGRVLATPTFARRNLPAVEHTVAWLERLGIPLEVIHAPAQREMNGLTLDVLHPPAEGPAGNENSRSLVLLVRYGNLRLLLTGDLEGTGLDAVLPQPVPAVDVFMAPHHGSECSDPARLAAWARPRVVVSCQGPPRSASKTARHYEAAGADFLSTARYGAVTVRVVDRRIWIETFRHDYRQELR